MLPDDEADALSQHSVTPDYGATWVTSAMPATPAAPVNAAEHALETASIPRVGPVDNEASEWTRLMPPVSPVVIPVVGGGVGAAAAPSGADVAAGLEAAGMPLFRPSPEASLGNDASATQAADAPRRMVGGAGGGGTGKPRGRWYRFWHSKHRRAKIVLTIILALILALVGTAAGYGLALNHRVNRAGVDNMLPSDQPSDIAPTSTVQSLGDPYAGSAINILVIGSDSRSGDNADVSGDTNGGQRSDTTFIMHISADRTRVDVVSIPRDTLITIPNCVYADQSKVTGSGYTRQKFNAAFAYGASGSKGTTASGVACTIQAINQMSNNTLPIDAYVVVDFAGFANIVNAIGGVDIWLPCAVSSPGANNLKLPAGLNHLDGDTATNYARAREGKGLGDGSDLMRIQRQQALFMAVANKALGMNVMTNVSTLYNFVGSIADSVTTNLGSILDIAGFAYSLRYLSTSAITFMTLPIADAGDGANVVLVPSKDDPVWQALASDTPIADTGEKVNPVGPASSTPTDETSPGATPGQASSASPSQTSTSASPPPGVVSAPLGQCS